MAPASVAAVLGFKIGWLLVEAPMPIKAFTFYSLARDLENTAPGFGITIDYDILESLMASIMSSKPPANLKDELRQLADAHNCDFRDWREHRFVQFVKRKDPG